MSKQFWLVAAAVLVVLIGIFSLSGKNNSGSNGSSASKPTQHIEGAGKDGITLVEYGDYQCPYCGAYFSTIKQVEALYSNEITFQFRNFPLTSLHQNAFAAARAAEAAGLMGQFWQMHDLLYTQNQEYYGSNQKIQTWINASSPETIFAQDAQSLGLNVQKFEQLYASDQVNNLINADESAGNALNVNATPSFYLDGKPIQANNTVSAFATLINAEIAKKTGQQPTTTTSPTSTGSTQQSKQ